MATLTTYTTLLTQLGAFMGRADFTAQAPVWVSLAEAKINRLVRAQAMETKSTSFSINAEYVNVPSDFLEAREFYITSTTPDAVLTYKTADMMTQEHTTTGQPGFFAVVGSQFRFAPSPDATYTATLVYYAKPAALAAGTQETNSLFPANSDLYLYGSLTEALGQNMDDSRFPVWDSRFKEVVAEINRASARGRWGGNQMSARPG